MWTEAIEDAVLKTRANIERFGHLFPHVSNQGVYQLNPNTEWTAGFWPGLLWLSYQYSGDEIFRGAARSTIASFQHKLDQNISIDHHDIGFLYSLSSNAQWMIEKDEAARKLTLQAADVLMNRWRAEGQYLQAWGPKGDPANGGRIIIDCLMNLPLLYWATEQTGNPRYKEAAIIHADKSRKFLVRGDDSSYHTFYFDPANGDPLHGGTHQGYNDGSTWTRGQAWGIYGFALSYRYTKNPLYLETSIRLARYFIEHLPADDVAHWDFDVTVTESTKRDSSASAIASAGILELLEHLDHTEPDFAFFEDGMLRSMKSLVVNYSTIGDADAQGLLKHGSYSVRSGAAPDDFMIWGDYFYLEALLRLEKGFKGFWYE